MLLIDSSAIVKFASKEPGWDGLAQYMVESLSITLSIPELASALRKKITGKGMQFKTALGIIDEYAAHTILLDQNKYIDYAFEISSKNNISIYDSLFIAAAAEEGYELLTCDEKQYKVAKKVGVTAIHYR